MGGAYSRKMLSRKEQQAQQGSTSQAAVLDLSTAAPSALAKALFTSEHSFLDLLAEGDGTSSESVTGRRTRAHASAGPAAAASLAPTPLSRTASEPASAGGGVSHSRTMDEDWFRHVHHSILGHGGDLRTSALSLYLPTTNGASTTTTTATTTAAGAAPPPPLQATTSQGSSQPSPRDSGVGDVSSQTSPSASPVRPPGATGTATGTTAPAAAAGDRAGGRAEREVSGLSSQGNRFYNSCWTIYVDSTVVKPNLESTLRCTAYVIVLEMESNHRYGRTSNPAHYDSLLKPLDSTQPPLRHLPPIPRMEEVFTFLARVFKAAQLKADSAVVMLIYIHRMLSTTGVNLTSANWRRIVVGGLIMSSKVWEDQAIWNVDFCTLFPQMRVSEFNELERLYLTAMQFQVNVKASLYTKCYFLLRDVADLMKTPLTLQPLSSDEARKLELRMLSYRERIAREYGDVTDRTAGANADDWKADLRRVKSDNIYVTKAGSGNAYLM